jgi:hypothetical protein
MKKFLLIVLMLSQTVYSQQYDGMVKENKDVDSNNEIYKTGNVFIFDYEIIYNAEKCKLRENNGMFANSEFAVAAAETRSIEVDKIHLLVLPVSDDERTNENQTEISYLQDPVFASLSSTGVVENPSNVWLHPFRKGFFNSLETAPFPYVKKPLKIGAEWSDQMKIGEGWRNKMWGLWEGSLLLSYNYKIVGKESIEICGEDIDCFIIESTATSHIGETKLKSYFSESLGFVRLEYELLNDLKVNMWLIDFKTGKEFNDTKTFFQTGEYIKS